MKYRSKFDWLGYRGVRFLLGNQGRSQIEAAIFFCILTVTAALFIVPLLENPEKRLAGGDNLYPQPVDQIVTGSVKTPTRYKIRKSVLQPSKTSQCIIYPDGRQFGDC